MIVFNFFGGPGIGKSTFAARLFADLKVAGVNTELIPEYAKELVWNKDFNTLKMQAHVLGEQFRRQEVMLGQVDCIVNDSPLLLSRVYNATFPSVSEAAGDLFGKFDNVNFMLVRHSRYNPSGRTQQDPSEAYALDITIRSVVHSYYGRDAWYEIQGNSDGFEEAKKAAIDELRTRGLVT